MKSLLSLYTLKLPFYYVYMLQQVEYNPRKFHDWCDRILRSNKPIRSVMTRKSLIMTSRARLLLLASYGGIAALSYMYIIYVTQYFHWGFAGVALILALPQTLKLYLWMLTFIAHKFVVEPQQRRLLVEATAIFANHKAVKIAVLGSYGKTTMKELLSTVLSEGSKVAVTPGNMNVTVSHARFAKKLQGDEDIIIVEFGEGEPGDIHRMAEMLKPDYAIITGLAPNHLDFYPDLEAVAKDLLSIYDYVAKPNVFVSAGSAMLKSYIPKKAEKYAVSGSLGWKTRSLNVEVDKTTFTMSKGKNSIVCTSGLLGRHQIAPLCLVAAISDKLGLTKAQIESGIAKTKPYEHRMQPRLVHGAWLIDDTYNGNLEGLQAGLELLKSLEAKRRWYVTPGLVDQGSETERVHRELGMAIAQAKPDIVVLMDNSVRPFIESSMNKHGFSGELRIEDKPLEFYTQIEHLVAAGDVVLMQNDWTDNYS